MTITELANRIKSLKSALIFCHIRPDGDTLSCAFALKSVLNEINIPSEVVCGEPLPKKYLDCGLFGKTYVDVPAGFDGYVAVDCATPELMGNPYVDFAKKKDTLCIDHHPTNSHYADYLYYKPTASCSMLIYELAKELNVSISPRLANIILAGIFTDTGSFVHTNTDAECLSVAAELTALGGNLSCLNRALFCNKTKNEALFQAEIESRMKLFLDDRLAILTVRKADLDKYGVDRSATEGMIDFPLGVGSVEVAISILESADKKFKLSFRSKNIKVSDIAAQFGGGGHPQAAGAMLCGYYEDVVDKLVFTVGNYL